MRHLRPIITLLAIAAITVACSSPGASGGDQSEGPGASEGGGPSAAASSGGGGGGGGGGGEDIFGDGSATYHITGDYTADGELGFVPLASQVSQDSYSLSFTDDANSTTIIIISIVGDSRALSYGDQGHTIPGVQCDWNITRQEANGVAGTFNCDNALSFAGDTGAAGEVDISGTFDARK